MPTANPEPANPTQAKASNFLANLNRFTARPEPHGQPQPAPDAEARRDEAPQTPTATPTPPPRQPQPQPQPRPRKPTRKKADPMPATAAQAATRPAPRAPTPASGRGTQLHRSFTVAPGTGTKVLTARVPRDLHARLTLLATAHKFAETDDAEGAFTTVNAIVMDALHDWLAKHDPQQSRPDAA